MMRMLSNAHRRPVMLAGFCSLALVACRGPGPGAPSPGDPAVTPGLSHLDLYLADRSMPLDRSVLIELANGVQPTRATAEEVSTRLTSDGFDRRSAYGKRVEAALRGADASPVSGDGQGLIIVKSGDQSFGPHVELAIREDLRELDEGDFGVDRFHWLVSVINREGTKYDPLKIEANGVYCLFVGRREKSWTTTGAYLLVVDEERECRSIGTQKEKELQDKNATSLVAFATEPESIDDDFDDDELPTNARWEFATTMEHVIGVRCAKRWCQIAPLNTELKDLEPIPADIGKPEEQDRRNARVKGWYDFQVLAHLVSGKPVPSGVVGRIHPLREKSMELKKKNRWHFVAEIILLQQTETAVLPQKYREIGLSFGTNQLKMCQGAYRDCGMASPPQKKCEATDAEVWGQIVSQAGVASTIFAVCAVQDKSKYKHAVWATRWHWDPADEGMWVRCLNGCCQPKF